jgi:hypothetical protein
MGRRGRRGRKGLKAMFPSLPSAVNGAGAAAGAASGAASVFNAIQSAANQEANRRATLAAQQTTQDQKDQEDYVRAIQEGWVPADNEQAVPGTQISQGTASKSMIARTPTSSNQDPNRIATIGGKRMYKPTDLEAGKAFVPHGGLGDALMQGAGWDGKTPMTQEQSHSLMMAINEAQPKDEPSEYDNSGKYIDSKTGKPVPGFVGKKTHKFFPIDFSAAAAPAQPPAQPPPDTGGGMPGGAFDLTQGLTPSGTPAGRPTLMTPPEPGTAQPAQPGAAQPPASGASPFSFALPEKPEKPDVSQILPGQVGPNGGPLIYDKNTQTIKEIPIPKGSKAVLNANQEELSKDRKSREAMSAADRAERAGERKDTRDEKTKATFRGFETTKQKAIDKANQTYRIAIGHAGDGPDTGSVQLRKDALENLRSDLEDAQSEYRRNIQGETGNDPGENNWPADYVKSLTPAATGAKASAQSAQRGAKGPTGDPLGVRKTKPDPLGIR